MSTFDPAAHLHKQGWMGKGTALKQGHATRPLAVVQKKNLGGIGRDRDEAIPFWDQIFASTAASIFTPSPTPSGSSTPIPLNSAHTSTRSWTTTTFGAPTVQVKKAGTVSVAARVNKEQAKKGLYSRFFRGKVVEPEESEAEIEVEKAVEGSSTNRNINEETMAGPSNSVTDSTISIPNDDSVTEGKKAKKSKGNGKGKGKEREGETKDERKARRAEKAKRKLEREERRALKASTAPITDSQIDGEIRGDKKGKTKRKRKDNPEVAEGADGTSQESKKVKVKKVVDQGTTGNEGLEEDVEIEDERKEKKRKRKEKKAKKEMLE